MLVNNRGPRGKYQMKGVEPRGVVFSENKTLKAFWAQHTMEDVITWTEVQLEENIEAFLLDMQERSIERNPKWWYPEWKKLDPRYYK